VKNDSAEKIYVKALGRISSSEELRRLPVNVCERLEIPGFVPKFLSVVIEPSLSSNPSERPSFNDMSEVLKKDYFRIADGVDSDEISVFINLMESEM
jgi:hypothetical protein